MDKQKIQERQQQILDLVMVDGLIVPLETLPEQYQITVRQARAEGKDISFTSVKRK